MKVIWTPLSHSPHLDYPRLNGMMAQIITSDQLGQETKIPLYYGRLKALSGEPSYDPVDWLLVSHLSPIQQSSTCDPALFAQAWDMDAHVLLLRGQLPLL